jgi:murein DD-endopeptidase MepM/ murein hydrolase activator NlpD
MKKIKVIKNQKLHDAKGVQVRGSMEFEARHEKRTRGMKTLVVPSSNGISRRKALIASLAALGALAPFGTPVFGADLRYPDGLINPLTGRNGGSLTAIAGFLDKVYAWEEDRQHLGADFGSSSSSRPVYAIASGEVTWIYVDTAKNYNASAILVSSKIGNVTRTIVYGHVLADSKLKLKVGSTVTAGQQLGSTTKYNSYHLHLGVNTNSRVSSFIYGSYGWGRAPFSTSSAKVAELGWVDPVADLMKVTSSGSTASALVWVNGSSEHKSGVEITISDTLRRNRTSYVTLSFRNKGSGDVRLQSVTTTSSDVKLDGSLPSRIRAGKTENIDLALRPSRTGTQTYGVTIKFEGGEFKLGLRAKVK